MLTLFLVWIVAVVEELDGDVLDGVPVLALVEHGELAVAVHAEPVLRVVDGDEVRDELLVRLPDVATPPLLRPEHQVVVQRVVHHGKTWK